MPRSLNRRGERARNALLALALVAQVGCSRISSQSAVAPPDAGVPDAGVSLDLKSRALLLDLADEADD